jgi:hypothetical protein
VKNDIDTSNRWWRACGVIVSTDDQIFIRAFPAHRGGSWRYVNLRNGATLEGEMQQRYATFGVWSLWVRDPLREKSTKLLEFDIHKQGSL